MKKIDVGQMLTLLANFGVIVGLLLLVYELNQAREFAKIEFLSSNLLAFQEIERDGSRPPSILTRCPTQKSGSWMHS
jgi:hypothetical protein